MSEKDKEPIMVSKGFQTHPTRQKFVRIELANVLTNQDYEMLKLHFEKLLSELKPLDG